MLTSFRQRFTCRTAMSHTLTVKESHIRISSQAHMPDLVFFTLRMTKYLKIGELCCYLDPPLERAYVGPLVATAVQVPTDTNTRQRVSLSCQPINHWLNPAGLEFVFFQIRPMVQFLFTGFLRRYRVELTYIKQFLCYVSFARKRTV